MEPIKMNKSITIKLKSKMKEFFKTPTALQEGWSPPFDALLNELAFDLISFRLFLFLTILYDCCYWCEWRAATAVASAAAAAAALGDKDNPKRLRWGFGDVSVRFQWGFAGVRYNRSSCPSWSLDSWPPRLNLMISFHLFLSNSM